MSCITAQPSWHKGREDTPREEGGGGGSLGRVFLGEVPLRLGFDGSICARL